MHVYHWKSKTNGPELLKWLFYRTEIISKINVSGRFFFKFLLLCLR